MRCRSALSFAFLASLAALPAPAQTPAAQAPAPAAADGAAPTVSTDGPHNTLRWKTKGGSTNFAYEVFRSESPDGPFVKVNKDMISGHLMYRSQQISSFSYTDSDIDPAKDYWYYVESINLMNERARLTPVQKAPAKTKAAATPSR